MQKLWKNIKKPITKHKSDRSSTKKMLKTEEQHITKSSGTPNKGNNDTSTLVLKSSDTNLTHTHNNKTFGMLTLKVYKGARIRTPFSLVVHKQALQNLILKQVHCNIPEDVNFSKIPKHSQITEFVPALITDQISALIYLKIEFDGMTILIEPKSGTLESPRFESVTKLNLNFDVKTFDIQVWIRLPVKLIPKTDLDTVEEEEFTHKHVLVGICQTSLDLRMSTSCRLLNHEWVNIVNPQSKVSLGLLQVTVSFKYVGEEENGMTINDFKLITLLGQGHFGKVLQVQKKDTGKVYAMKVIKKSQSEGKKIGFALLERYILSHVNNPFIIFLEFAFQSAEHVYLVMPFINGGELFFHLQKSIKFSLQRSRFYVCELMIALKYLHNLNIIYRDLKAENVLIDHEGHIKLCDFGLSKFNQPMNEKTHTFCGTSEYLAPELLTDEGYTQLVDYWALGILLYEMMAGFTPFEHSNTQLMMKRIMKKPLTFPCHFNDDTKSLLSALLQKNPLKRLGQNGMDEVKQHLFFKDVNWRMIETKSYIPSWRPFLQNSFDTGNFDPEFTENGGGVELSYDGELPSVEVQKMFENWSFERKEE